MREIIDEFDFNNNISSINEIMEKIKENVEKCLIQGEYDYYISFKNGYITIYYYD
jgi:hypothetical protein